MSEREVISQLMSAKKDTRLVLRRNATGLKRGDVVKSAGGVWIVSGWIARSGDAVLRRGQLRDRATNSQPQAHE